MTTLTIKGNEYKIKYGYNCFCDTDLLDRVSSLAGILNGAETDSDVSGIGKTRELFCVVRDLIFVGFQKFNPVDSVQEIGDLLDDYREESTAEEPKGLLQLFSLLSEELANEGFLSDLMESLAQNQPKAPQDHKKSAKAK